MTSSTATRASFELDETVIASLLDLGGEDFLRDVLQLYLKAAGEKVAAMGASESAAASDPAAAAARGAQRDKGKAPMRDLAHALKSTSAQVGALAMRDACVQIERSLARADAQAMAGDVAALQRVWEGTRAGIAARLKALPR